MADEYDDPEMSYRRGYEHGAWKLFEAIDRFLPRGTAAAVRKWIEVDVKRWRIGNMRGETGRKEGVDPGITRDIAPPADRLEKL
jgi:hypothetical protein